MRFPTARHMVLAAPSPALPLLNLQIKRPWASKFIYLSVSVLVYKIDIASCGHPGDNTVKHLAERTAAEKEPENALGVGDGEGLRATGSKGNKSSI